MSQHADGVLRPTEKWLFLNLCGTGPAAPADETAILGEGCFVWLEVADNGTGMDANTLAKAFDPYFTTKPTGAGSGIGLSQVLAFARQSGGDAQLQSTVGAGTRVSLYLPRATMQSSPPIRHRSVGPP